ncbi:MAG: type IX secretion system outer membrane channel protein PorV [Bacteroidaceae bacterium]|nr:type IX secretion system outer membrane channel protein PorV [Bacteroidaceae bacterium]
MKKILSLVILLVSASLPSFAQKESFNPIYTGVTSLSIAPDARAAGMGDVGAATDPDVNSQYWNPAKYPFCISRSGISLNYTPWLRQLVNDIDLANITGYYRIGNYQALGGSLRYFSLGEVMLSDGSNTTIRPYEFSADVSYSMMLSETFSLGAAARFIYSDLAYKLDEDVTPGKSFAMDLAAYYNNYIMLGSRECQLGLGLNISNIGSKISYDEGNTEEFLPTNLRLGASLMVPIDEYNTLSFSADANKLLVPTRPTMAQYIKETGSDEKDYAGYNQWLETTGYNDISPIKGIFKSFSDAPGGFKEEMEEIQWSVGAEYTYHNQFSIRAGYHHESESKGNRKYFTVGAGFRMNVFSLDAGYVISTAQSNPLDQTLRFSLAFDMDGIKDIFGKK